MEIADYFWEVPLTKWQYTSNQKLLETLVTI